MTTKRYGQVCAFYLFPVLFARLGFIDYLIRAGTHHLHPLMPPSAL